MFIFRKIHYFKYNYNRVRSKWSFRSCVRCKSSSEAKNKQYSHTILTPKTDFPTRSNTEAKDDIQRTAQFSKLYEWQRQHNNGPEFVLHDGPPYANGDMHMGHAVNKIIKDICNRSQVLNGNKVHYTPGWDCHGLPIELKALQKAKKSKNKTNLETPVQIREYARSFALETVEKQKDAFNRWGVMADWDKNVYLTLNNDYIRNELKMFNVMFKKGLVFRALKPVYWSPSSRTALAEAELEYDAKYKSTEAYVRFPFEEIPEEIKQYAENKTIYALIWTTTPWTLIANRGICFNEELKYALVSLGGKSDEGLYVVGVDLIEGLKAVLGVEILKVVEFSGKALAECTYRNKLTGANYVFLNSDHVTHSKGTGLVHMAPAHGPEDFLVALKNNMAVECNVDEAGKYTNLDDELNGLYVLKEGQSEIIHRLDEDVLYSGVFEHSYPLDWRTKKPVIVRASQQWFIDTAVLKNRALEVLETVNILPQANAPQYRLGFKSQLEKRPYWCISRQRSWGAPIPVLYDGDQTIVDERIIDRLCDLMDTKGPEVWWTCDAKELLTDDVISDYKLEGRDLVKGTDILDIWLDSGLSWSSVLDGRKADLYVEGVDQFTGWFQSSLLTAVALKDDAPYKSILVHGFAVDENKRKMSKSIGNVIDPLVIVYGGKDKSQPAYGIDTLRWWVASHGTQHSQIIISNKLIQDCQNEVIRIRNVLKYLLGVISDLEKTQFDLKPTLNYFDQYLVNQSHLFRQTVLDHYKSFKYNSVVQNVNNFISNKVSGLYCHCIKDRLYCSKKDSEERLTSQLTMHTILTLILKTLGPILPHLVEEVWKYHPLCEKPFFFTKDVPLLPESSLDDAVMDLVLNIKSDIHLSVKNDSLKKYAIKIKANSDVINKLNELNLKNGANDSVLNELLEVTAVSFEVSDCAKWDLDIVESNLKQCLRCRKFNIENGNDTCLRCEYVLSN